MNRSTAVLLPLAAGCLYVLALLAVDAGWRLVQPHPLNPWEAGLLVDAARGAAGEAIYEPLETGHATAMYGALAQGINVALVKAFGPALQPLRAWTLLCALALVALCTWLVSRLAPQRAPPAELAVCAVLFLGLHLRVDGYFTEIRPDVPALLAGTLAVLAAWRATHPAGERTLDLRWLVASQLLLVLAFFLKQTAALAAGIQALAWGLEAWRARGEEGEARLPAGLPRFLLAGLPVLTMALTLLALRFAFPLVFLYMIEVPGAYGLHGGLFLTNLGSLLLTSPLWWVLLPVAGWRMRRREHTPWLLSALLVTAGASALGAAKFGGDDNSWLPLMLVLQLLVGLALLAWVRSWHAAEALERGHAFQAAAWTVAIAITLGGVAPLQTLRLLGNSDWARDHAEAVAIARQLEGQVVCFEDPTITLWARGQHDPCLILEYDAQEWSLALRPRLGAALDAAEHVIKGERDVVGLFGILPPRELEARGFRFQGTTRGGRYGVWQRER